MNLTLDVVNFVIGVAAMAVGAGGAYWGAMTAVRVQLARLEARLESFENHVVKRISDRADDAHDRLDRVFGRRGIAPDSTR